MGYPETFEGYMFTDPKVWQKNAKKQTFQPKTFGEYDIDIKIEACGVCGSDLHTVNGGWGGFEPPLCVGHEIVGTAIKVGPKVTKVKVGDRCGVGAQAWSCLECGNCKHDQENYCPKQVDTYGSKFPNGETTQGGYASHQRAHEYFVFKIPDAVKSEHAAPMLCGGLTVFSPLVRNGAGPGTNVGIIGVGGLGHFGLLFAQALGANVWAMSRSDKKKADVEKLGKGQIKYIDCSVKDWADKYAFHFDVIINTADSTKNFDLKPYCSTLKVNASLINVGLADDPLPQIDAFLFMPNGCKIGGSHIGNHLEMERMLNLAAEKNVVPWVEPLPVKECVKALTRLQNNEVRFRHVLVGFEDEFGT